MRNITTRRRVITLVLVSLLVASLVGILETAGKDDNVERASTDNFRRASLRPE